MEMSIERKEKSSVKKEKELGQISSNLIPKKTPPPIIISICNASWV